ncbi:MAG: hypothetical protein AB7N80_15300 [Bdellovibrionales bacterium]
MKSIKKTFAVSMVVFSFSATQATFAQTYGGGTTPTNSGGGGQSEQNTNNRMPPPTSVPSTNASAGQGKSSQYLGAGMNVASGAMFVSMGNSCSGFCAWYYAMAAISFVQAAQTIKAAKQSGQVYNASLQMPDMYEPGDTVNPDVLTPQDLTPDQLAAYEELQDKGYVNKTGGLGKYPNGQPIKPGDFNSAESMAAAGMPSGSIGDIMGAIAKVNAEVSKKMGDTANDPNVVAMGLDSGGGGYRGPASDSSDSNFDEYLNKLRNPFGMNSQQKQQMVAGKTVGHGDDQIGVKVDDIFRMVHRRYQEKRAGDEFIEPAVAAAAAAAGKPAPGAASGAGKSSLVTPKRSR